MPSSIRGRWLPLLGRLGYIAKGMVYVLTGILALLSALRVGGAIGGGKDALAWLGSLPFGLFLVAGIGMGLACYTLWRFALAAFDPGEEGTDSEGLGRRAVYVISGLSYLGLAAFAGSITLGLRSSSEQHVEWIAALLEQPLGEWAVAGLGALILAFGGRQFYRAARAGFMESYALASMSKEARRISKRLGQLGLSARGLVFCMIGVFVIRAGFTRDPEQSAGLGGVLLALATKEYGSILLGCMAIGLVAYGVFCFSYARYRDFEKL